MSTHRIFAHSPPELLAENLWRVRGTLAVPIPRNMTIWRSPRGKLVLYSVIAMHEDGMRALEALGEPALIVVPHRRHQMDLPFYRDRYKGIAVGASHLLDYAIPAETIPGTSYEDLAMRLPIPGGHALCVCELLSNVPMPGPLKLIGTPGGGFGIARAVKWREVRDKERTCAWLLERAADPLLKMILVGHGDPITDNPAEVLRQVALKQL